MKIEGNTWVVTGAAAGIGYGATLSLARRGANVVMFDMVPQEKGEQIAKEIDPERTLYCRVNVADKDAVKAGIKKGQQVFSTSLRGCVHCAGIRVQREWSNDMCDSIEDFKKLLDVNTTGTFIVNAAIADAINEPYNHPNGEDRRRKFWTTNEERGVIVNFSSAAAHALYARCLAYGITKLAVIGLSKSFADFLGPSGIRVCSISPSIVTTAMAAQGESMQYFKDDLLKFGTFPREPAAVEDVIPTIEYILENKFINAVDIEVGGAWRNVTQKAGLEGGTDPRLLAPALE